MKKAINTECPNCGYVDIVLETNQQANIACTKCQIVYNVIANKI